MVSEIRTVGVVGLGTMGAGIVEVFARNGFAVTGVEPNDEALARGRGHLERSTGRALERGRLSEEERDAILGRVTFTTAMSDLADVDLVVEAVPELMQLKRSVFGQLDEICRPEAILATNTSSLSVTDVAATTSRPGQVVGMHFFNPAPVLKLVEVVHTVRTDSKVTDTVRELAVRLGKSPVVVADRAGFVANWLLFGYLGAAVRMLETGRASREDIDTAMRAACGYPMGPFQLLDLIGLDTSLQILETMYAQSRDRLHAPSPLLRQLVATGALGRKSGRGFYRYDSANSGSVIGDASTPAAPGAHAGTTGKQGRLVVLLDEANGSAGEQLVTRLREAGVEAEVTQTGESATDAAARTGAEHGEVVGLHPVPRRAGGEGDGDLAVVEVVPTVLASEAAIAAARSAAASAGVPVIESRDRAGFVVDALLFPYLNDALRLIDIGYATADDVDTAMTKGCGYPVGPVALLDEVGLEPALARLDELATESREPGEHPVPLLQRLVAAGRTAYRATSCRDPTRWGRS